MAKVSVIIPCYNQGIYISEAISSVLSQTYQDVEIIVVNDGSTDVQTNQILAALQNEKITIKTTANHGLAAARNNGISASSGKYILPLDADDRIAPEYIEQGVKLLDAESDLGIVYCRAKLFGEIDCEWTLPPYSLEAMLKDNVIFCSALYRRSAWDEIGGYDTGMIYGWEDYDFWLSIIERGGNVRQLEGHHFFYRVSADSMVRTKEKWQKIEMFARIFRRHEQFFSRNIEVWIDSIIELGEPYFTSQLYIDEGNGFDESRSIARKVTVGNHAIIFDTTSFGTPRNLRFDPLDQCTCVQIEGISLEYEDGIQNVDISMVMSNADCQHDKHFMFSTNDPNMFIPIPPTESSLNSVEVKLSIVSVGEQSLREIIDCQKGHHHRSHSIPQKISDWWRFKKTGNR